MAKSHLHLLMRKTIDFLSLPIPIASSLRSSYSVGFFTIDIRCALHWTSCSRCSRMPPISDNFLPEIKPDDFHTNISFDVSWSKIWWKADTSWCTVYISQITPTFFQIWSNATFRGEESIVLQNLESKQHGPWHSWCMHSTRWRLDICRKLKPMDVLMFRHGSFCIQVFI